MTGRAQQDIITYMNSHNTSSAGGKKNILILLWATGAAEREFLLGFSRYARRKPDWSLNLLRTRETFSDEARRAIESGEYDGVVTDEVTLESNPSIRPTKNTALVVFGTRPAVPICDCPRISYIENDNADIGRFGARHFLGLGRFASYGFVLTTMPHGWAKDRAQGFRDELAAHRCAAEIYEPEKTKRTLSNWIKRLAKPAALMVAWDNLAIETIGAARRAGCAVPAQVAVLGVDNDDLLCNFSSPSISSICPDHGENGFVAASELDGWLSGRFRKGNRLKVCSGKSIVQRESTGALPPAAHLILSAQEFIRRNATRNIGVKDVVEFLGVSRRLADLRFSEFCNCTIHETIIRFRIEEVRKLLLSTRLSVKKVARVCGFTNVSHLETLFRARCGDSMQRWRQTHTA